MKALSRYLLGDQGLNGDPGNVERGRDSSSGKLFDSGGDLWLVP